MTERVDQAIPYERQSDGPSNRMCGAAALSMVYRSLARSRAERGMAEHGNRRKGMDRRAQAAPPPDGRERRQTPRRLADVTQADLWAQISRPGRSGSLACATHLMARDALRRGFAALAVQAKDPLQMLLACRANGIRAILNHRLKPDGAAGHFTVLVGMDSDGVTVHDPLAGPSQRLPHDRLLELWQPRVPGSEVVGNVLIAVADHPPRLERCLACAAPIPPEAPCPKCQSPVPLAPTALLGCTRPACIERSWLRVCCPTCDFTFPTLGPLQPEVPAARTNPLDLGPLFVQLDRFRDHLLSHPKLAGRDDLKQQLAAMEDAKEKLRLGAHEDLARQESEQLGLEERLAAAAQEREKLREAREVAATPAAPLDGNALGDALLRSLGIVK